MRSLATREAGSEISAAIGDAIAACKAAGYDLVIVETAGIGQGDAAIVPHVDVSLYVMTPEFGAASQLEKIDMLDFADFVAINKFDRRGAEDALRDVRKQMQRNREAFGAAPEAMPVFGTIAARFNDDGVTALYHAIAAKLADKGLKLKPGALPQAGGKRVLGHQRRRAAAAPALPRGDRRDGARLPRIHARSRRKLARERQQLAATQDDARQGRLRRSTPLLGEPAGSPTKPRSCSTPGRRRSRPTRATSRW